MSNRIAAPEPDIRYGWALSIVSEGHRQLLGKHCSRYCVDSTMPIMLFRTRRHAVLARETLTSYRYDAKPIRVKVTIEVTQ